MTLQEALEKYQTAPNEEVARPYLNEYKRLLRLEHPEIDIPPKKPNSKLIITIMLVTGITTLSIIVIQNWTTIMATLLETLKVVGILVLIVMFGSKNLLKAVSKIT